MKFPIDQLLFSLILIPEQDFILFSLTYFIALQLALKLRKRWRFGTDYKVGRLLSSGAEIHGSAKE